MEKVSHSELSGFFCSVRESKQKIKIEHHYTCYNKFNAGAEMYEMRDEDELYRERLLDNEEVNLIAVRFEKPWIIF